MPEHEFQKRLARHAHRSTKIAAGDSIDASNGSAVHSGAAFRGSSGTRVSLKP